jgi:hypothetical protein
MQRITHSQHYVPQFYLRKFAIPGQQQYELFAYEKGNAVQRRNVRRVASESDFYEAPDLPTNTFEGYLKSVEDHAGQVFREFEKGNLPTAEARSILAGFLSVQILRVPVFLEMAKKVGSGLTGQQIPPSALLALINGDEARFLLGCGWCVYVAGDDGRFVTSDNPLAFNRTRGLYDPSICVYFPLNPKMLLVIGRRVKVEGFFPLTFDQTVDMNCRVIAAADRFVFSDLNSKVIEDKVNEHVGSYVLVGPFDQATY